MIQQPKAKKIINSLRSGIPPKHGVEFYAVGNEKLLEGVERHLLGDIAEMGIIRFISGSWGSGKTHLFRQFAALAYRNHCLVANVELGKDSAMLNKFETVFKAIVQKITSPTAYEKEDVADIAPFGRVLQEAFAWLAFSQRELPPSVQTGDYANAEKKLMRASGIDIDFKKMILKYWETFSSEDTDVSVLETKRGEILQWFSAEAAGSLYKKKYEINKFIGKDNSKRMLQSLAAFVKLSGYQGLVVLFDEAEASYSAMRKAALRDAHNNLLTLINEIQELSGLFLVYATTPDFFNDPRQGIDAYGALAGRIGKPSKDKPPYATDKVWNLEAVETKLENYQSAALKIFEIYKVAYPKTQRPLLEASEVEKLVESLHGEHPKTASINFWRLLMKTIITRLDSDLEGNEIPKVEDLYNDAMDELKND